MPDWRKEVYQRLQGLGIDPGREESIAEELAQHLEGRYYELISAGADEPDAYAAAVSELQDLDLLARSLPATKRPVGRGGDMAPATPACNPFRDLLRDLKYGLRTMAKARQFSIFALMALALGIGATTTVFTVVNTLLLHPLPVDDVSRLAAIYTTDAKNTKESGRWLGVSYPNLEDCRDSNAVFTSLAGYTPPLVMTLAGPGGPERIFGQLVTEDFFSTLGIQPAAGRFFRPEEVAITGATPAAVLSYGAWQSRFGGSADIIGRVLDINQTPFTVIGVAPRGFIGVSAIFGPDAWIPASVAQQVLPPQMKHILEERGTLAFHAIGRLKENVSRAEADAAVRVLAASLARAYPESNEARTLSVQPVTTELFSGAGGEAGLMLTSAVLLVIGGLVLLIACSNVASLLMARATSRRQELAVRIAIGASRARLLRQLLTESVLLAFFGGLAGLFVAYEGCQFLWSFRPAETARNLVEPKFDTTVFLFAFAVSLLTGVIFGLAPAVRASRADLVEGLREETRIAGLARRSAKFGKALLVGQVAFSSVCLFAAALFLRAVERAWQIDPGFDRRHLAVFLMNPEQSGYDVARLKTFHDTVSERVSNIPGIAAVSWSSNMPFWAHASRGVRIEGEEQRRKSENVMAILNTIDENYFDVMRIALVDGRNFTANDRAGADPVVIINDTLARRYWPNGSALGRRIQLSGDPGVRQIVGVVKTANYSMLGEAPQPCIYLPLHQNSESGSILYVRSEGDPSRVLGTVQRAVRSMDPNIELSDVRTGTKLIGQALWSQQLIAGILGIFGSLALALASIGLYGVLAYSVARRKREIGVRMAMGADRYGVVALIVRQGMTLVGVGVGIGLAASLVIGRFLSKMLFGLSPTDPVSLLAASGVLSIVAILACYLPARTASRMDPITALREG